MGGKLVMPPIDELPDGPRRLFVRELFFHVREAKRPTPRELAADILADDSLSATASRETIRKMLRGETVPRWSTVDAVFTALCKRSGIAKDERRFSNETMIRSVTFEQALRQLWDEAVEGLSDLDLALGAPDRSDRWQRRPGESF
ncbi:hypothetical protein [Streptomyces cyaneofuscatus]|uniref:hypothetical protein n=1 Tax=Streptomyces cyaneofuscatus TaxID=66883 RepID=UPI00380DB822